MKTRFGAAPLMGLMAVLLVAALAVPADARAKIPAELRGQIITSEREIAIPEEPVDIAESLKKQDMAQLRRDKSGMWIVHFLVFFEKPLPVDHAAVVLFDAEGEPVTVANVEVTRGQTNLACQLMVEGTRTPHKEHVLQIYYVKDNKPVVLARKPIVLK